MSGAWRHGRLTCSAARPIGLPVDETVARATGGGVDAARRVPVERGAVTAGMVSAAAREAGVCVRPVVARVRDLDAGGEPRMVPIACGSTREDRCPPCADRAKRLRIQQCREGWHLDTEPEHQVSEDDPANDGDVEDQDGEMERRVRSTWRLQGAPSARGSGRAAVPAGVAGFGGAWPAWEDLDLDAGIAARASGLGLRRRPRARAWAAEDRRRPGGAPADADAHRCRHAEEAARGPGPAPGRFTVNCVGDDCVRGRAAPSRVHHADWWAGAEPDRREGDEAGRQDRPHHCPAGDARWAADRRYDRVRGGRRGVGGHRSPRRACQAVGLFRAMGSATLDRRFGMGRRVSPWRRSVGPVLARGRMLSRRPGDRSASPIGSRRPWMSPRARTHRRRRAPRLGAAQSPITARRPDRRRLGDRRYVGVRAGH
jgi:hypothetical protein